MNRRFVSSLFFALLGFCALGTASGQDLAGAIAVLRPDGSSTSLCADRLRALPRTKIVATVHDKTEEFEGSELRDVLQAGGVDLSVPLRGPLLRRVVTVHASDGYVVAFALAEIDPSLGAKKVYLVDRTDGAPLGAEEGPWRLVVPSDVLPARWARRVQAIVVSDIQ